MQPYPTCGNSIIRATNRPAWSSSLTARQAPLRYPSRKPFRTPFDEASLRHPVGCRRWASIAGKYADGVFCNLPDGAVVMCRYSFHYEDSDFKTGDTVMIVIQRYDEGKKQIFGKIVGK